MGKKPTQWVVGEGAQKHFWAWLEVKNQQLKNKRPGKDMGKTRPRREEPGKKGKN